MSDVSSTDALDQQKQEPVGPRANKVWNTVGGKNENSEVVLLWVNDEEAAFFGEDGSAGKIRQQEKRKPKY